MAEDTETSGVFRTEIQTCLFMLGQCFNFTFHIAFPAVSFMRQFFKSRCKIRQQVSVYKTRPAQFNAVLFFYVSLQKAADQNVRKGVHPRKYPQSFNFILYYRAIFYNWNGNKLPIAKDCECYT